MNDQDYIRKAVELANGFGGDSFSMWIDALGTNIGSVSDYSEPEQWALDALAAQLIRQVDATHHYAVITDIENTQIEDWKSGTGIMIIKSNGYDRTMNTIKAIVDSEILKI